jgi:hypothetical protein
MNTNCGAAALREKSGEPQAEQKLRSVFRPVPSESVSNEASVSPLTLKAAFGTPTTTEKGLLVWRWQSVQ